MPKKDKPLTKDALASMQVIDSKGRLVGKVKDVVFEVGKSGISLAVEDESGEIQTIEWKDIQAASDFIILKPAGQSTANVEPQQEQVKTTQPAASASKSTQPMCPTCNQPLTWIPQYSRWYCYNEKKYPDMSQLGKQEDWQEVFDEKKPEKAEPKKQSSPPLCPTCNKPLTWIPQYSRWYCYNDKKYV
ncbi:MAG: PRC-barrel domain-containing protein [Candidatus Bathyarchaeia archaeon]|jgi:sporulation protein YlmC with PRC-barrel domain